jgi:hypothetical protein
MPDYKIINSNIAISSAAESSFSTAKVLAADFSGAVTNALNITIPNIEKIINKGLIGKGDEFGSKADPDYARHTGMTFTDRLNTDQFAVLAARILSGTITSTTIDTGVNKHVIEMKASNADPQLKSSTVGFELGGLDLILPGMVGNNLSVQVQGGGAPSYQAEFVGSGDWKLMADQTPALVLPDPIEQNYVGQRSQSALEFNDGTLWNVEDDGRLDSFNINFSNNLITGERRIGDPLTGSGTDNDGARVRQITRGDRTLTFSAGIYVSNDKRGYLAQLNNTVISGFKFSSVGNVAITGVHYHKVTFSIPRSVITVADLGGDQKGLLNFTFEPIPETGNLPFTIEIINENVSLA